jgi:hypothetical protein
MVDGAVTLKSNRIKIVGSTVGPNQLIFRDHRKKSKSRLDRRISGKKE